MNIIDEARNFFNNALNIKSSKQLLSEGRKKYLFKNSNGPSFTVDFSEKKITVSEANGQDFDFSLESNSTNYHKIFKGTLSPGTAYHKRDIYFDSIPFTGFPWLTRLIKIIQDEAEL